MREQPPQHRIVPGSGGSRPGLLWLVALLTLLVSPPSARAYEAMVQATVVSQSYQIRDANDGALSLRRLDTYLRIAVLDLLPTEKKKRSQDPVTQMHFIAGMRLRADFGGFTRQWDSSLTAHGREGGVNPLFELMYAHLAVTDLGGVIDLRLGRQFQLDPMDFYGYDGLYARFRLPIHVAIETVAGLRNGGRYAFDMPIFQLDGTDLTDTNPGWKPMVGVALSTHDLGFLSARVAYRASWHVLDPSDPGTGYPEVDGEAVPRTAMVEEKISAFVHANLWKGKLQPYGGIRYNLLTTQLDEAQIGLSGRITKNVQLRAEYVRESPDFDGDSIFNLFNAEAYQEIRLWYEQRYKVRWRWYVRATLRLFSGGASDAESALETNVLEPDVGGGLGFVYLGQTLSGRVDLYYQEGYGGRTVGAYGYYRHEVIRDWLSLEARAVIAYWDDDLSVTPEGVSAGLGLGGRLNFGKWVALHVILEDNFGTHYKSDLRLFALLNFSWCTTGTCVAGEVIP
ncbi:MAG: hypothetical protein ABI333_25880 [bacterium]